MVKIIETNYDKISFQSRVIEVESWEYIIKQFTAEEIKHPKTFKDVYRNKYLGVIRPKLSKIENLKYDESRLMCDVILFNKERYKKLIELIG